MRVRTVAVDGYGKFSQRTIELSPGLQIVVGPNEQGKSTLRSFIADMLYGQKRSLVTRLYEESNELRCPWASPDTYGGRLIYHLDNGREIEVYRRFDRKTEAVHVYDRTHGTEITEQFEQLRNREPAFAQAHLGIPKEVFMNVAAICHMSLEGLGDNDALIQIREKLLSLVDSGDETGSADSAIKYLEARIAAIGQPNARTRPLPSARARLTELERELEHAQGVRREVADIEAQRRALLDEIDALRREAAAVQADLDALEHAEHAKRLCEAERIEALINEATARCFELREAAHFPVERRPDFQRAEMVCTTARQQLERLRQQRAKRVEEVGDELERLDQNVAADGDEIPDEYDHRLAAIEESAKALRVRLEQAESARDESDKRLKKAENELAALPDYSRLADDPVTRLRQLASTFDAALRHRHEHRERRQTLRDRIAEKYATVEPLDKIFERYPDFDSTAREYEVRVRMYEEQILQLEREFGNLQADALECQARVPGFVWLSVITGLVSAALLTVAILWENPGAYIPAAFAAIGLVYFAINLRMAVKQRNETTKSLEQTEAKIFQMRSTDDEQCLVIEGIMVEAGCQTIRELKAKYDVYRKQRAILEADLDAAQTVEDEAAEAEQRVEELFTSYCETFARFGEELRTESDVEDAAGRAIARYQSYRDAKRRIFENREQLQRHDGDIQRIREELDVCRQEEVDLGLVVRQMMRDNGYPEEGRHDSALSALRSYRIRTAQLREKRRAIRQGLAELDSAIKAEERDAKVSSDVLSRYLAAAGVDTPEDWHDRAKQAEQYREFRQKLEGLNEQLRAVLMGQNLKDLRHAVNNQPPVANAPSDSPEMLKQRRDRILELVEVKTQEEHALHIQITEKASGARSLSEIEEDRLATESRLAQLEAEMEAAAYAISLIDKIARDKHSKIAPQLTARASQYLSEITAGAYNELFVNRELGITIRIPQTQRLREDPEKVLSKGTVDQIYFALRLAMVQSISETGESIPMLLDDPFPNYDDHRLGRALQLLARVAQQNQVLLFTCREDVVRAAQAVEAPILYL